MGLRIAQAPRLSSGVVVVRRSEMGWLFLMLRAYRNWDFPKGAVEPGEQPLAAARREVREETAIEELKFNWGEVYRETGPYSHNKIARYYLAETPTQEVSLPISPELGRPEHDEWRWVTFEEALSLCSPRLDPILRWAAGVAGIGC
jgi:8-oxo-dGTP pyrophosphatase MutT (NUDIX family)